MSYNEYLNALAEAGGQNFENLDDTQNLVSPQEYFEALEVENFLIQGKQMPAHKARTVATRIVKNPTALQKTKVEMQKMGIPAGYNMNPAMPATGGSLSAQVNFQIKRLTAKLEYDLPVPLFGAYDFQNNYKQVVSSMLPSGVSIGSITGGRTAGAELHVDISYTDGTDTDIVRITLQEYAYASFLEALKGSKFLISTARYSVSDTSATGLQQLTKKLFQSSYSMFGKTSSDNIPLSASKSPFQQQNGIVDILGSYVINAETSWVLMFQPLENQEVTIGTFIAKADKIGLGV